MGVPQEYVQTDFETWARSDRYHNERLIPADDVLDHALQTSASLPNIAVSKAQGKFLHLLAKSIQAKHILEVGTLGGYSTIWLARALPDDGELITLELNSQHAEIALSNFRYANLDGKIKLILGAAKDTMKTLQPVQPFDLIFIDADKPGNLDYFIEAKRLIRKGGVIIVDNVVRYGRVADPDYTDNSVEGVRRLLDYVKTDNTVDATTLSTVGEKSYDGFMYAVKL